MIYDSYAWKRDLLRRKQLIIRYNTKEQFEKDEESTFNVLEKAVFYSGFIIRKLIDCKSKLSDEADEYKLTVKKYKPLKEINKLNRWPEEDNYDWEHANQISVNGKDVCNWLIHSYVFFFCFNERGIVIGFFVSSDFDRNKLLYYIRITDWIDYMKFIASDSIVSAESVYDQKKRDYIYKIKKRGIIE